MASSPRWKVYDKNGEYQASCKEVEAAAAIVGFYGEGATIRASHDKRHIVWTEGVDGWAIESYDTVAETATLFLNEYGRTHPASRAWTQ